jgi:hypothetical protein
MIVCGMDLIFFVEFGASGAKELLLCPDILRSAQRIIIRYAKNELRASASL